MTDLAPGHLELHLPPETFLLDQVDFSVIVTDAAGTVTYWNRGAESLYGWSRDEALGQRIQDLVVEERDAESALAALDLLRSGQPWEGELAVHRKDGERIFAGVRLSPVFGDGGRVIGTVGVATDITERWRAQRRLRAQHAVTAVLAEADSFPAAARGIIEALSEALGWAFGAVWEVDREREVLRLVDVWHHTSLDVMEFEALTLATEFLRGRGLPGRVWESARAAWIADVTKDRNFPRAAAAMKVGLRGAFGFPIFRGAEVHGVIEFFSQEIQEPDQDLLAMMTAVGTQIGQFIDRKLAETALRESEARKSAMLESALDAIVAMDHEGRIADFNPTAEAMFGHRRQDVLGRQVEEVLVPPHLRQRHRRVLATYLETGENQILGTRVEFAALRADGTEFPVELAVNRVAAPGPPLFIAYIRDLSERAEAGRDRAMLASMVETSNDAIFGKDLNGIIRSWNAAARRMYGYTAEEVVGKPVSILVPPGFLDDEAEIMAQVQRGQRVVLHETRRRRKDGTVLDVEITVSPIRDSDGRLVGASSIGRDVTARKQAERRQRFLVAAGKVLTGSLDYETTMLQLAHLAVPELADWCITYVPQGDGSIKRLAIAHADPARAGTAETIGQDFALNPDAEVGVPWVLRTGTAVLQEEATSDMLAADADDPSGLAALLAGLGIRSWMCVPMVARGRTLGAISFVTAESGRRYGPDDLRFVEELARDAALAADNARLYEAERRARHLAEQAALRTALLNAVSTSLSEALAPSEVAEVVVRQGMAALGARAGLMAVASPDGVSLQILHEQGYAPATMDRWRSFPLDESLPLSDAVRTGEPIFLESLQDRAERYPVFSGRPEEEDHATVCLPMIAEGRAVGGLTFTFGETRRFEEDDRVFLSALARQSAQALVRARLYESEQLAHAEAEQARDRLAFLAEASRVLSSSLDYEKTLAKVARLAVPRLADWCSIDMLDEAGAIKQVAVAHVDRAKVKWAKRLRRRQRIRPEDPTGVPAVIRTGRPELYPVVTDEMVEAVPDPKVREAVRSLGLRSVMILPMTASSRTLGAISLVWSESGRTYGAEDLELAEELARRAAQAADNARLYRDRDTIARTLQQSLLPPELPKIPGVDLASMYLPAGTGNEVGGDFYDVFDNGDGAWGLVIGDVCGKGPLAASVMGLARHTLRAAAMRERRPSRILAMLSEAVLNQTPDGRFLTVCYVRLRANDLGARLTVCCGGHPLPAVLRADGTVELAGVPGTLLGLFEDPTLSDRTVDLCPGDALVLYTDGITDVAPSAMVGGRGVEGHDLAELLSGAAGLDASGIVDHVKGELSRRIRGTRRDDMALLVVRVGP
jgi:PAS domain S-box-containing protein